MAAGPALSLEEQAAARLVDFVELGRHVGDHRLDALRVGHGLIEDGLEIHRIGAQVIGQLVGQTTTNGVRDWETFWRYPAIGAAVILVGFWWLFRGAIETEAEAEA